MATTPKYSAAQVALIVSAITANGGVADKSVAETLAANPAMNDGDSERSVRAIIAKMRNVVNDNRDTMTYAKVQPTTKNGGPVTNKSALVADIATLIGVTADTLDGLEKAPKSVLELLADFADAQAA